MTRAVSSGAMELPADLADDEDIVAAFEAAQDLLNGVNPEGEYELGGIQHGEKPDRFIFYANDGTVDSPIVVVIDGLADLVPTPSGPNFRDLIDVWMAED